MVSDRVRGRVRDPHRACAPHRQRQRPVAGPTPCPPTPHPTRPASRALPPPASPRCAAQRGARGKGMLTQEPLTLALALALTPTLALALALALTLALARTLALTLTLTPTQERVDYLDALGFEWEIV